MGLFKEIRARARYVIWPVLGVCAVGYFGYHVIHGERGLLAWWKLGQRVRAAKQTAAETRARREHLEHRVRLLYPGSLDRDMLDERARVMLNYGDEEDIVILENERN